MALTASDTTICNMALANLGITTFIGNIASEQSTEAQVMNTFYKIARDATLRGLPWPFAGVVGQALVLVTDFTQIPGTQSQWAFSYRYPPNCLKFLRVASLKRQDSRQSRVPYKISQDGEGPVIYCNVENALCDFTTQFEDADGFPPDFIVALSFMLASLSVRALTGGDPFKLGPQMEAKYKQTMTEAMVAAINEDQVEPDAESEFITARSEGAADGQSRGVPWFATDASNPIE